MDNLIIIIIIPRKKRSKCSHVLKDGSSLIDIAYLPNLTRKFGFCIYCQKTLIQMGNDYKSWREFKIKEDSL